MYIYICIYIYIYIYIVDSKRSWYIHLNPTTTSNILDKKQRKRKTIWFNPSYSLFGYCKKKNIFKYAKETFSKK